MVACEGKRETARESGHIIAWHPITCTEVESTTGRFKDGRQTKNQSPGYFWRCWQRTNIETIRKIVTIARSGE